MAAGQVPKKIFPQDPEKSYGLMALVSGEKPALEKEPEDTLFTWPHLIVKELYFIMIALIVLHLAAVVFDAPLEDIANPAVNPNPDKAPWYFLGLQEMVSWGPPIWGGFIVPTLFVVGLLLIPFIDRDPRGSGVWFASGRRTACLIFGLFCLYNLILIFIGMYCRGPNWDFYWPWEPWPEVTLPPGG